MQDGETQVRLTSGTPQFAASHGKRGTLRFRTDDIKTVHLLCSLAGEDGLTKRFMLVAFAEKTAFLE